MARVYKRGRHVEGGALIRLPAARRTNGPLAVPIHWRARADTGRETQQMGSGAADGRAVHGLCGARRIVTRARDGDLFRPVGRGKPRMHGGAMPTLSDPRGKSRYYEARGARVLHRQRCVSGAQERHSLVTTVSEGGDRQATARCGDQQATKEGEGGGRAVATPKAKPKADK
eukprot:6460860-Amphidinium_carterae.1